MSRLAKRILVGLSALVALLLVTLLVRFYGLLPRARPAPTVEAPRDAASVARGRYLATHVMGCVGCHSTVLDRLPGEPLDPDGLLAGRDFGPMEGFPGRARARNLTPDADTGIGRYSDGELLRAMRDGIGKDGRALFPMMPYPVFASALSDEDALAIIAYLRSVPPKRHDPGPMQVSFPVSMFIRAVPAPAAAVPPAPSSGPERGRWLLKVALCADCHTPKTPSMENLPGLDYAGGMALPIPGQGKVYSRNITADAETGIGAWSDEEVRRAIEKGVGRDGRALYGMPWPYYAGMTEEDRGLLLAAVRSIPAVRHEVPKRTF